MNMDHFPRPETPTGEAFRRQIHLEQLRVHLRRALMAMADARARVTSYHQLGGAVPATFTTQLLETEAELEGLVHVAQELLRREHPHQHGGT